MKSLWAQFSVGMILNIEFRYDFQFDPVLTVFACSLNLVPEFSIKLFNALFFVQTSSDNFAFWNELHCVVFFAFEGPCKLFGWKDPLLGSILFFYLLPRILSWKGEKNQIMASTSEQQTLIVLYTYSVPTLLYWTVIRR